MAYFIIYLVKGYVPILALHPAAARTDYFIFGVGLLIHNMPIVIFFSLIYHLVVRGNAREKRILKVLTVISIGSYLLLLQRYQLIMLSFMALTVLYYVTRSISWKTLALFIGAGFVIVYSISILRAGQVIQFVLYKTSLMKFSPRYAMLTEPYMYIVMNVENFVRAVGKLHQHTYGYYTFDFALALTGLKHWLADYFAIVDYPFLNSGYNTYTIFWTFYRDFGILGISILPLLGGLFVGSVYYALRRNPSIGLVSCYAVIVFVMGLSFFLSPLGFLWFVYIVAWMILIFKLISVHDRPSSSRLPSLAGTSQ